MGLEDRQSLAALAADLKERQSREEQQQAAQELPIAMAQNGRVNAPRKPRATATRL
jgi:hypothetical protein